MTKYIKETKSFYSDDKLNKGYSKKEYKISDDNNKSNNKFEYVLPPLNVITEYEDIHPGTLKKILEIAEQEQKNQLEIEKIVILAEERAKRIGRFFGLFAVAIISAATYQISLHDTQTALIFALISFGSIFLISLVSYLRTTSCHVANVPQEKEFIQTGNKEYKPYKKPFYKKNRKKYYSKK